MPETASYSNRARYCGVSTPRTLTWIREAHFHGPACSRCAWLFPIPMYYLHVTSNIMSLGGLALAINVLVDAAIVMVENGYRQLSEHQSTESAPLPESQRRKILLDSAKQVGPAIFFSLVIIVVSFLPVFLLEAQEGRMFLPLAWTKTLAVGLSSVLAITLVPVLMVLFIRGRLIPESRNPISRITQAIYLPILRLCLRFRKTTLLLNLLFLIVTLPLALHIGSQFMPPLFEGSALYMPTALPGISIGQASQLLQEQDRIIRTFPEVETVFGSIGRSDSATDNAPLDMYDTTVMLKPRSQWRPGMTYENLIQEMDSKLQFPGLSNTWTMPVIDLSTKDYGGFVTHASNLLKQKLALPPGFTYKWSGEYEFELRAKDRLQLILPIVFCHLLVAVYGVSLRH